MHQRSDMIHLKDLRFFSHVGVFPEEKANGQDFILDIDLFFDAPIPGVDSDLLEDSISYADVYDAVKLVVESARFDLIERLAGAVADTILAEFDCSAVRVKVKKPNAPIAGDFSYMGVTIRRRKEEPEAAVVAYIGLGSNLGDREATLVLALDDLARHAKVDLVSVSSLYETAPWGVTDQPEFLNAVAAIKTSLDPFSLLRLLQSIENRHGRVRDRRWGERTLDLDILEIDDIRIDSGTLTIPHPRMNERAFVLIPLAEVKGEDVIQDPEVKRLKQGWYCPEASSQGRIEGARFDDRP